MNYFFLVFSIVIFSVKAQVVEKHKENFSKICTNYKEKQFNENICEGFINELTLLESKLGESIFFDKTLTVEDKTTLKNLKIDVLAIRHFIGYQQACAQEYFTFEELTIACKILGASFQEEFIGKHCMKIIKTELNSYVCYLAENNVNEHKKFNFKFKRNPYGVGQGETDIQAKGIKDLYNNKTEKDIKLIELVYLNCVN